MRKEKYRFSRERSDYVGDVALLTALLRKKQMDAEKPAIKQRTVADERIERDAAGVTGLWDVVARLLDVAHLFEHAAKFTPTESMRLAFTEVAFGLSRATADLAKAEGLPTGEELRAKLEKYGRT